MLAALFRLGLLVVCASLVCAQNAPKVGTGSISGKVIMDGKHAVDALVILSKNEQVLPHQTTLPPRTTTDSNGQYRFSGLPAGKYFVNVAAPGYVNPKRPNEWEESSSITLADGEAIESINFTLVKGGVITGRVSDEEGRPVIEENLVLYRLEDGGKKVRAYCNRDTDDRGAYRCFNLQPGKYIVGAGVAEPQKSEAEGFYGTRSPYGRSWYPNTPEEERAQVLELLPGGELLDINLKLGRRKKGVKVTGRVLVAETNKPVPRAQVGYSRITEDGKAAGFSGSNDSITNAEGEFRLLGMMPGKYKLTPIMYQGGDYYGEPVTVDVGDEDLSGMELKMEPGSSITGVAVLEDPNNADAVRKLANMTIFITFSGNEDGFGPLNQSLIGADGGFQIKGVRPGKANLRLSNYTPEHRGFSITRIERDGVPVREGLEVKVGESITGLRVTIGYGSGLIRGELKYEGGSLPDGVGVHLKVGRKEVGQPLNWVTVDTRNRFAVEGLTSGTYELLVETHSTRPPWNEPALKLKDIKETVDVTNGQEAKVTITVDLNGKGGKQ